MAFMPRDDFESVPVEPLSEYLLMASTFAAPFLALVFGVLGVFSMASEYSSGMLLSSLAVVVGLTFVLPPAFQMLTNTGWAWVPAVGDYLPTPLGIILSEGLVGPDAGSTAPGYWHALVSMGLWAAAPIVPAAILFKMRDAK